MRLPEEPSSYGCPQGGPVYNIMRSTRLKFKSALCKCKRHEIQISRIVWLCLLVVTIVKTFGKGSVN